MSLIAANGIAFDYAGEPLLRDVSFAIERGDRWGIIGRNGSGKTTLFRLLAGSLMPTAGSIARESGVRIGLLDQHRVFEGATTVWEAAAAPFAHLIALEHSLAEQAHALERDASEEALARYDRDLHRFEREGGYSFHATVDAVLEGIGFDAQDAKTRPLEGLSGGERGRVGLARQLVAPSDVLLLDEPTNHLDIDTTRWLEDYLVGSGLTLLAISHDRAFLDGVANHILHLEAGTAFVYETGYRDFVELRTERRASQQKAYDVQQKKIAAEEDYIRRNIAGQNTRQAKGRRTRLERLPRLSPPPAEEGASLTGVRLRAGERGGDQVLVARDVRLELPGRVLLDGFSAYVRRGDVVGIVGPNGAGKSTLLRAIAGERTVDRGELRIGAIRLAHYRQDLAQVPVAKTVFGAIHDLRPMWDRGQVQAHLGRYGFSGDDVQRIAGSLSGGEQARLALAIIVLAGANLLLFDEPTNHLDVESIEALEDALRAYDGTVLLVSHDRALLAALTTRIWAFDGDRIEDYPGAFPEWLTAREERARAAAEAAATEAEEQKRIERDRARRAHATRASASAEQRAARRAVEDAERRAHEIEAMLAELTGRLHDPALYETADGALEAALLQKRIREVEAELEDALEVWHAAEQQAAR